MYKFEFILVCGLADDEESCLNIQSERNPLRPWNKDVFGETGFIFHDESGLLLPGNSFSTVCVKNAVPSVQQTGTDLPHLKIHINPFCLAQVAN